MGADQLGGSGKRLAIVFEHEMDEVKALDRTAQSARVDDYVFADADFGEIAGVLLEGKAAAARLGVVFGAHAKGLEKSKGSLVKKVGIPHDVHMPHDVTVIFGDGFLAGKRKGRVVDVHRGRLYTLLCRGKTSNPTSELMKDSYWGKI